MVKEKSPDYKGYIQAKANILKQELKLIKYLIKKHNQTIGEFYETILKKFLNEFIPKKFKVGTGFIIDIENNQLSRQVDIIIYEDGKFPPIYQHNDFVIVECNTVLSTIEVKAKIDSENIKDASENMESVKNILPYGRNWFSIGVNGIKEKKQIHEYVFSKLKNCEGLLILSYNHYFERDKIYTSNGIEEFLKRLWDSLQIATTSPNVGKLLNRFLTEHKNR